MNTADIDNEVKDFLEKIDKFATEMGCSQKPRMKCIDGVCYFVGKQYPKFGVEACKVCGDAFATPTGFTKNICSQKCNGRYNFFKLIEDSKSINPTSTYVRWITV